MKMSKKECELNKLSKFLLLHVAGSDDARRIERTLKINKGVIFET